MKTVRLINAVFGDFNVSFPSGRKFYANDVTVDGKPIIFETFGSADQDKWKRIPTSSEVGKRVLQEVAAFLVARWAKK